MEIQQIDIKQLKEYEKNAKKHDTRQINNVMESIKEFGMVQPIVVDDNNTIIIGNCRYKALKKLKWKKVPVVKLENLSEQEVNKLRLLDNKLNESEWDFDLLLDQIQELNWDDFDIDWGLDDFLKKDEKSEIIEFEAPDVEDTSISQVGDIYILGKHRLICGDSTDVKVIERLMGGVKADLCLQDPPYGINIVKNSNRIASDKVVPKQGVVGVSVIAKARKYKEIENDDSTDCARKNYDIIKTISKNQIIFGENYFTDFLPPKGCWCVWDKKIPKGMSFADVELAWTSLDGGSKLYEFMWTGMKREGKRNVELKERVHPTQKPVGMLADILEDFSKENDSILDCFGGSGSTLIACEQLNRRCFMCELDENYVDVIVKRYINFKNSSKDVFLIREGKKYKYDNIIR